MPPLFFYNLYAKKPAILVKNPRPATKPATREKNPRQLLYLLGNVMCEPEDENMHVQNLVGKKTRLKKSKQKTRLTKWSRPTLEIDF